MTSAAVLFGAQAAQAASIWAPVNSGTTDTINAVAYQSPTRLWYATTNGRIAYWNGSAFVAGTGPAPGENFVDIAFQPTQAGGPGTAGLYGYAVTSSGHVWRTADGGVSWTQLPALTTLHDCSMGAASEPVTELNGVVWSDNQTVYLLGNDSTLEKSTMGNSPTPGFAEINKTGSGSCAAESQPYTENLTDAAFLGSNPNTGFMIQQSFGRVFSTSTAFMSGTPQKEFLNNYTGNPRLTIDQANPNRIWAVDHGAGGSGCGTLCFGYSTDGGVTFANPKYVTSATVNIALYDVSSQGGVEVAAGGGGEIWNSTDGVNFYAERADGALASENWHAEDAYDAAHAVVAGEGGALALTSQANVIPTPSATISGPTTVAANKPTVYTATFVDPAGVVDPYSYTWTGTGYVSSSTASATFTFPAAGDVPITFTYKDLAGGAHAATLTVHVTAPGGGGGGGGGTPPPSGSSPSVTSTGGGTVVLYRVVTVTGRKGRFIPITLSAKAGRKFVISIYPRTKKKHPRKVAGASVTLRKKGTRTFNVPLSSKVTTGKYTVVVRIYTLKGRAIGKTVQVAFILK